MTLEPSNLFIVADGMGGQQAGEQASLMAVELIPRAIARRLAPDETEPNRIKEAIRDAVAEVNQEILGSSGAVTEFTNMGTTVVLAQFRYDRVFVAGIGDSRAYRLRDGRLERLTKDHSLADALLEAGTISAEELADPQVQERAVPLPRQQGCAGRPRGRPGPRRPARRPAADGQRRADRRRPRPRARQRPGHDRRPPAGRRDPQGHGAGERFEGQRHLPDHPRRRPARPRRPRAA